AGLGVAVLPGLDLMDLMPGRNIKAIPLAGGLSRTVSLLCPKEQERTELVEDFLDLAQKVVAEWKKDLPGKEIKG
ncbi:MAG: hypothetical protein J6K94_03370, partial [Ruminiclostridium sp.]|nr:hypothetical protein [Ruminiclostridium sp.]